jgi:hypothetical protein
MARLGIMLVALSLIDLGAWLGRPGIAAADGAFPDSMSLFVPADRPSAIVLATNFGLVVSNDDGATFHLVCEQAIAPYVILYQMGAPPDDALYAATPSGLFRSSDGGCSWSAAQGQLAGANVADAFADPLDPSSVFALAHTQTDGGDLAAVFQSTDGGRSFDGAPLFTASATTSLTGVEKARAAPRTLYLTMFSYPPATPLLAHSNAGSPFAVVDESAFTTSIPYLAAVDPGDANTLYLRLRGQGDALAISRDAGATLETLFPLAGRMSALLRRASGTLLVGSSDRQSWRSVDGGHTFAVWPEAPHVRALAERGQLLYAAADDAKDDFALGRSADEGAHWEPLLHFRDIRGPLACGNLPMVCAGPWAALMALFNPGDGGARADGDMSDPPVSMAPRSGCHCALGAQASPPAPLFLSIGIGLLVAVVRARVGRSLLYLLRSFTNVRSRQKEVP